MAVKVNLYLDERKIKTGEKAPVKLRLYISRTDILAQPGCLDLQFQVLCAQLYGAWVL